MHCPPRLRWFFFWTTCFEVASSKRVDSPPLLRSTAADLQHGRRTPLLTGPTPSSFHLLRHLQTVHNHGCISALHHHHLWRGHLPTVGFPGGASGSLWGLLHFGRGILHLFVDRAVLGSVGVQWHRQYRGVPTSSSSIVLFHYLSCSISKNKSNSTF